MTHACFFHHRLAWNLIYDAIESQVISFPAFGGYVRKRCAEGIEQGWINADNRRRAREMFLFFDQVLLPGELDVAMPDKDVTWAAKAFPAMREQIVAPELEADRVRELWPFIGSAIRETGQSVNDQELDRLIQVWRAAAEYEKRRYSDETQQKLMQVMRDATAAGQDQLEAMQRFWDGFEPDPRIASEDDRRLEDVIRREFNSFRETLYLAQSGVPTFGPPPLQAASGAGAHGVSDESEVVVGLYFDKAVACPRAQTFTDALELRHHPSVEKWRAQMLSWSRHLAAGETNLKRIEEELKDANGYIQGARFLSTVMPSWSMYVTLPLGLATQLIPGLQPVGWVLLGAEALGAYGKIVDAAVRSPERPDHQWLLVSDQPRK